MPPSSGITGPAQAASVANEKPSIMAAMMKDAWSIFSPLEGVGEWEAVVFAELWLEGYELIQSPALITPP
jgi:hypothetical protein